MKVLLDIENYGLELTYDQTRPNPYELAVADAAAPISHILGFTDLPLALDEAVARIMDKEQVYAIEELPFFYRKAYDYIATNPEANKAVEAFLYSVLEGIANANLRGE